MDKQEKLNSLKAKMESDNTLPLKKGATNLVFGEGDPDCEFMFIGEGPGYWEDLKARPFVGNAGAFLNQLISLMGEVREGVYITNVVHYRPSENRDPLQIEIDAFQPYLDKMIEIINPKTVITLGRYSMAKFLPGVKITSVHGKAKIIDWKNAKLIIVPMYHPAAGLRNPSVKALTIEDFRDLKNEVEKVKAKIVATKKEEKIEQTRLI